MPVPSAMHSLATFVFLFVCNFTGSYAQVCLVNDPVFLPYSTQTLRSSGRESLTMQPLETVNAWR